MQIYTKILLGMAVGAVIGLTLGPNSPLLERDAYQVRNAARQEFRLDRNDPSSKIALPAGPLQFRQLEVIEAERVDLTGASSMVPTWARVRLVLTERVLLHDAEGRIARTQPKARAGDALEGWLELKAVAIEGGGFQSDPSPVSATGEWVIAALRPVGKAFMRGIQMVIVPLVFASLLVGVAGLGDVRKLGRLGGRTLALYLGTTAIAVSIGLVVANLIQPGRFIEGADRARLLAQFSGDLDARTQAAANAPSTIDNLLGVIPTNPVAALASGDMLQIIFFALLFGIALTVMGADASRQVVSFFDRVQQAMVVIINLVMAVAPFGVAALVADVVGQSGWGVLQALLVYGVTVTLGLALHTGLVYGGLVRLYARLPLGRFMRAIRPAQLIAFSTSSSSATLPVSMECAEKNMGVSNGVASFVLPLGSTVNMDGTALYQGVAAVFIAQVFGLDLTLGDQIGIVATATLASVGAAGVPGAGMVTLAMVLTAAGIPQVGLALILGIDRLLDMFRTAVNVTGDLAVAAAMAVGEGEQLVFVEAVGAVSPTPPQT